MVKGEMEEDEKMKKKGKDGKIGLDKRLDPL